jgi:hypothetical protein
VNEAAAVIEFGRSAVGVASDPLSGFKGAVIFQKIRDAGCPERVRRIVSWQPRLFKPALEHVRASVRTAAGAIVSLFCPRRSETKESMARCRGRLL